MIPLVVIVFIAVSILVYLYPFIFGKNEMQFKYDLATNENTLKYKDYSRLFTAQFVHWDVLHLGVNMFSLYSAGTAAYYMLEQGLGLGRFAVAAFAVLYLFSGMVGGLFSIHFGRRVSAGASGALFGIIGFLAVYALFSGQYGVLQSLTITILINVVIGFTPGLNIDNWGHLGGFVGGLILGAGSVLFMLYGV
jgi:rhomboid protease GluP